MRKLILNILKEENEILERMMGLKLGKVKSALPSQYLVKTTKKQEKLSTEKRRLKLISSRVNTLYSQIENELKTLNWSDLELTPRDDFFFVVLPKKIKTKIERLSKYYEELLEGDFLNLIVPKDKITQLYEDNKNYIREDFIYVYVDPPRNRTHFPKGLPKSILGYDMGMKIYRNLLDKLSFIQSEPNATPSVQAIYRRLVESPEVNAVIYIDLVLVIDKKISKEEKIKILRESIYERYKMKPNRRLVLNKTIVLDSSLKREIGEKRILSMIEGLFYESKNLDYTPFSHIGYIPATTQGQEEYDYNLYIDQQYRGKLKVSTTETDDSTLMNFQTLDATKHIIKVQKGNTLVSSTYLQIGKCQTKSGTGLQIDNYKNGFTFKNLTNMSYATFGIFQ
jgi:hypothetical protein